MDRIISPQNSFPILEEEEFNTWFSNFRQWEIYELPPDEICPIKFSQWDPAVEAAYALFNAFEFSRKISLNVIWKNVKDDGSRTHFVLTFFFLWLQRLQILGSLKAYKNNVFIEMANIKKNNIMKPKKVKKNFKMFDTIHNKKAVCILFDNTLKYNLAFDVLFIGFSWKNHLDIPPEASHVVAEGDELRVTNIFFMNQDDIHLTALL